MALDKVLACIWSVSINGNELDLQRKRHITGITINTACDGSDVATIDILDKDMVYINDNIYVDEASVHISLMFVGSTDKIVFDGYISAIDIDFPDEGIPQIRLTCFDCSHVMNRKKKKRSWEKVTRLQVAQKIAQEYGFTFEGETSYEGKTEDTINQSNQTDIDFLESLAAQEKPDLYMCKLVGKTLYYKKKGLISTPVATVHYKEYPYDVVSFNPQINRESVEVESEASDISTDTKRTDTKTTNYSNANTYSGNSGQGSKVNTSTPQGRNNSNNGGGSNSGGKSYTYDPKSKTWK